MPDSYQVCGCNNVDDTFNPDKGGSTVREVYYIVANPPGLALPPPSA